MKKNENISLIDYLKFQEVLQARFLNSLKILGEIVDLNLIKVKSGTKVLDWTIPNEWNVKNAYVKNSKGVKIIDFKNNLHLVNYSYPINKKINFEQLNKHLFKIKKYRMRYLMLPHTITKPGGFVYLIISTKKLIKKINLV